jgi:polygalacturonase
MQATTLLRRPRAVKLSLAVALALGAGAAIIAPTAQAAPRAATGQLSVPATCTPLSATLTASNEQFSASAEAAAPDTARIQSALNSCAGSGKAVELKASGGKNAFLSGPLSIGSNEVLLVDSGVTLYASRKPSDYQISGGNKCGTITSIARMAASRSSAWPAPVRA